MSNQTLINYILGIADNSLILGQRLGTLTGHGPSLETDIACTNISLDLFGQVRGYYQYAADLSEEDKTEDDFAFLRKEREYKNVLLVEQPNRDFAYVIARQYLFDVFHILQMQELQNSKDENLAAIAKKGIKEVSYHVRFSGDWMKRLGDGTEESHNKIQEAVNNLWGYTNELFMMTEADKEAAEAGIGVDVSKQVVENEILKEPKDSETKPKLESKKKNLTKDKSTEPKTELKKEELKTKKK